MVSPAAKRIAARRVGQSLLKAQHKNHPKEPQHQYHSSAFLCQVSSGPEHPARGGFQPKGSDMCPYLTSSSIRYPLSLELLITHRISSLPAWQRPNVAPANISPRQARSGTATAQGSHQRSAWITGNLSWCHQHPAAQSRCPSTDGCCYFAQRCPADPFSCHRLLVFPLHAASSAPHAPTRPGSPPSPSHWKMLKGFRVRRSLGAEEQDRGTARRSAHPRCPSKQRSVHKIRARTARVLSAKDMKKFDLTMRLF